MKLLKDMRLVPETWLKDKAMLKKLLTTAVHIGDVGNYWRTVTLLLHTADGCQMWVSKEVSDDMQATSIYPEDLEGVEWPHHAMEVYYEDPELPTILVRKGSNMDNAKRIAKMVDAPLIDIIGHSKPPDDIVYHHFQAENDSGEMLSLSLHDSHMRAIAANSDTGDLPEPENDSIVTGPMTAEETHAMRTAVALFLKLSVFVSAEHESVQKTDQQPTRRQGGKAGFRGRPKTHRLQVIYLPHHKAEKDRQRKEHSEQSGKRTFNGRRGHWRRFNSAFYKAMKGKKTYIFPIMGPDGTIPRTKFVVRNPT